MNRLWPMPAAAKATATRTATRTLTAAIALAYVVVFGTGCGQDRGKGASKREVPPEGGGLPDDPARKGGQARSLRAALVKLAPGHVYVYDGKEGRSAVAIAEDEARLRGLLVVDLGDAWAPFILQDGDPAAPTTRTNPAPPSAGTTRQRSDQPKPNAYRQTFVDLANDRINPDGRPLDARLAEHNFLEPFGIPPALSVLRARAERDASPEVRACEAKVDSEGLRAFTGNLGYFDRERAKREFTEAARDGEWLSSEIARREAMPLGASASDAGPPPGARAASPVPAMTWKPGDRVAATNALLRDANPKVKSRAERTVRGQERLRAVHAAQARLVCEGLLSARSRFTPGMFDLPTHEALAAWERKNDIFGWGFLGGETLGALQKPALDLDFETFRRVLAERIADAAGIVEDGSVAKWKTPATYVVPAATGDARVSVGTPPALDGGPPGGERRAVPNLIEDHTATLLSSLHVANSDTMLDFFRQHPVDGWSTLRVAISPPPLPPYYTPAMELSVEIDRGDVWYDFPFDGKGNPIEQPRDHFPHLTLFVQWQGQKIPLCSWRTTIGSWRSEMNANGKIYYRYKNSDVGPRFWKDIVAGPVWIPPDGTPAKDLLTRKVLDINKGPEIVVNTDVMGPGFQSAYGLVMAIHINRGGFDNQIRTHGSVDYTSIARRFSHGCHRLVNNRAVRLFDFILRRQPFQRVGSVPLSIKRTLTVDQQQHAFELKTRGYYYRLDKPIPVMVGEGRIMGTAKEPITAYVRKSGVDYSEAEGKQQTKQAKQTAKQEARQEATNENKEGTSEETSEETRPPDLLAVPDSAASIRGPADEEAPAAIGP